MFGLFIFLLILWFIPFVLNIFLIRVLLKAEAEYYSTITLICFVVSFIPIVAVAATLFTFLECITEDLFTWDVTSFMCKLVGLPVEEGDK